MRRENSEELDSKKLAAVMENKTKEAERHGKKIMSRTGQDRTGEKDEDEQ